MRPLTPLALLLLAAPVAAQPDGKERLPLAWSVSLTLEVPDGEANAVRAAALSPDGKAAVTAHADGSLRLWNAENGLERHHLKAAEADVGAVGFARDGKTFLTVGAKAMTRWDAASGKRLSGRAWAPPAARLMAVAPDLHAVAAVEPGGRVAVWPVTEGEPRRWEAHADGVVALAWSPDGASLATAGPEGTVNVWQAATGKLAHSLAPRLKGLIRAVAFTPDGSAVAAAHGRDGVTVLDIKSGKERQNLKPPGQTWSAVALGPGDTLAAGSANGTVRLWDMATREALGTFKPHAGLVRSVLFAPEAAALLSVGADGGVRLWRGLRADAKAAPEPKLTEAELGVIDRSLRGDDGTEALRAVQALAAAPRQGLEFLKSHLRPVEPADAAVVKKLLEDLGSGTFTAREKASKALEKLGDPAKPFLRELLKKSPSLEVERRVRAILERLELERGTPESRLAWRGVEALEKMGTPDARRFLRELAGGVEDAFLTRAARAAVRRLEE